MYLRDDPAKPRNMSANERLREVASILARGVLQVVIGSDTVTGEVGEENAGRRTGPDTLEYCFDRHEIVT